MFNRKTVREEISVHAGSSADDELDRKFHEIYDPHNLINYEMYARKYDELPDFDKIKPGLREKARDTDVKRLNNKTAGARAAANEISDVVTNMLARNGKLDAELVLAVIASAGGRECIRGIMQSLFEMTDKKSTDRYSEAVSVGGKLGINIVSGNNESYVSGARITEEISLFNWIALRDGYQENARRIMELSADVMNQCGTERYWEIHGNDIPDDPRELMEFFGDRLEIIFAVYCRYPQERMTALAFTAQSAVKAFTERNAVSMDKAVSIVSEYMVRGAHYFPLNLEKEIIESENNPFSVDEDFLIRSFTEIYAPYMLSERNEHTFANAVTASRKIYVRVAKSIRNEKGIRAETLLAVIASAGGRICIQEMINTVDSMVIKDAREKKRIISETARNLGISIEEYENGFYITGSRIEDEFSVFMGNAVSGNISKDVLNVISRRISGLAGKEDYWNTSFDNIINISPEKLADMFDGEFNEIFETYCRYPQEKMIAVSFALQSAVNEIIRHNIFGIEKAAAIIAEYGWRTMCFCKKLS
ncbi:MAG: hypothetical protein K2I00_07640 [Ruminococcus sp.]|nr:hypothetical protein [Ruminococcus sp.]